MSFLLLDTHFLIWTTAFSHRLSAAVRDMIDNPANSVAFSTVSIWEIAIKASLGREDFNVEPRWLRRELLNRGYQEIMLAGEHALAVGQLPWLHKDPFDRLLIAQAGCEGAVLLTSDAAVARYPGAIRLVG